VRNLSNFEEGIAGNTIDELNFDGYLSGPAHLPPKISKVCSLRSRRP